MSHKALIDRPIEDPAHDSLELSSYAEAMAAFIETCDTPVTIGIQGDWGIGKTSFLNLIADRMKARQGRRRKTPVIYFNTWQYAQFNSEEYLGVAVLMGILSAIEEQFPEIKEGDVRKLKEYSRAAFGILARAGNQLVKTKTGVDMQAAIAEGETASNEVPMAGMINLLQNYKSEFSRLVSEHVVTGAKDRLVIMIDDLDRVRPARALELLEAIKNFLDVPKCVFLLAVDYSVIQQGVAEKLGHETQKTHGKSYFDKIIQVPFNMPTSAYRLDRYVMSLLGSRYDGGRGGKWTTNDDKDRYLPKLVEYDAADVDFFKNTTALSVGSNPRSMKRVVNYAKLLRGVRQRNESVRSDKAWNMSTAKLLYALACMQLEWPELFAHFAKAPSPGTIKDLEDWDTIDKLAHLRPMLDRTHNIEQLKSNISGFFDEMSVQLDSNGDGVISAEEFKPVLTLMREANLSYAVLDTSESGWDAYFQIVKQATEASGVKVAVKLKDLFERSEWNRPQEFRLVPAGRRFCNIVLGSHQVGSLVSLKSQPVEWWLKLTPQDSEDPPVTMSAWSNRGHYGIGNLRIDVDGLLSDPTAGVEQINALYRAVKEHCSL